MTINARSAPLNDKHKDFVEYYESRSRQPGVLRRFVGIHSSVIRDRKRKGLPIDSLDVADIGCNVGDQSLLWAKNGHRVQGVDIDPDFIRIAASRSEKEGVEARFFEGHADRLPWQSESIDVCLAPELLEHVPAWRDSLKEFARVLRPGGSLFLSTSNVLCPVQKEFRLAFYSWYPPGVKNWCQEKATSTHRHWVNNATYPAVNWFSFYSLRHELRLLGITCINRFEMSDRESFPAPKRLLANLAASNSVAGLLGHMLTPYTMLLATKK